MLVVDASAFASWAFPDEGGDKVSQALIRIMTEEESATSAAIFPLEALHATGRAVTVSPSSHQSTAFQGITRTPALSREGVVEKLARSFKQLSPLRVSPLEFWNWSQSLELTPYDAAYLKVAVDLKAPLVTMDRALQRACLRLEHPLITDLA